MDSIPGIPAIFLIILIFFLACLWFFCLFDILTSKFRGNEKLLWIVVVLIAPGLGMFLYLILGKRNKIQKRQFDPYQKRSEVNRREFDPFKK